MRNQEKDGLFPWRATKLWKHMESFFFKIVLFNQFLKRNHFQDPIGGDKWTMDLRYTGDTTLEWSTLSPCKIVKMMYFGMILTRENDLFHFKDNVSSFSTYPPSWHKNDMHPQRLFIPTYLGDKIRSVEGGEEFYLQILQHTFIGVLLGSKYRNEMWGSSSFKVGYWMRMHD